MSYSNEVSVRLPVGEYKLCVREELDGSAPTTLHAHIRAIVSHQSPNGPLPSGLSPPAGPLPPPLCQDVKPSTWCEKQTDKCDQPWFQRNCALTCEECVADSSPPAGPASPPPCRDLKSTTWCAKKLDKCQARPYLQLNCALTCGECGAD